MRLALSAIVLAVSQIGLINANSLEPRQGCPIVLCDGTSGSCGPGKCVLFPFIPPPPPGFPPIPFKGICAPTCQSDANCCTGTQTIPLPSLMRNVTVNVTSTKCMSFPPPPPPAPSVCVRHGTINFTPPLPFFPNPIYF